MYSDIGKMGCSNSLHVAHNVDMLARFSTFVQGALFRLLYCQEMMNVSDAVGNVCRGQVKGGRILTHSLLGNRDDTLQHTTPLHTTVHHSIQLSSLVPGGRGLGTRLTTKLHTIVHLLSYKVW